MKPVIHAPSWGFHELDPARDGPRLQLIAAVASGELESDARVWEGVPGPSSLAGTRLARALSARGTLPRVRVAPHRQDASRRLPAARDAALHAPMPGVLSKGLPLSVVRARRDAGSGRGGVE